jgi:hypothetical protein
MAGQWVVAEDVATPGALEAAYLVVARPCLAFALLHPFPFYWLSEGSILQKNNVQ